MDQQDHPRGEAEWQQQRDELVARIAELERAMSGSFREWEEARHNLAEWDKKRPNAPGVQN